jgi:O-antigen/teichoic acid export membrane protein
MTSTSNGKLVKRIRLLYLKLLKPFKPCNTEFGWIVIGLLIQAAVWPLFITATERGHISAWAILSIVLALAVNLVLIIVAVRPSDLIGVRQIFASAVLVVIGTFSYYYWECGTTKEFNMNLTHFDAFYFAIGTLGTGTGNISASNTAGRVLQSGQMITDFILIVFIAGAIFARISNGRQQQGHPSKGDIR